VGLRPVHIEPDAKVADLVGRLIDDSKRIAADEVRLAKLEVGESLRVGARGAIRVAIAFGVGIIALVAFTLFLTTILGRLTGALWIGALIAGALEVIVGAGLVMLGVKRLRRADYTLGQSRAELRETATFVKDQLT
jgi:hypothetical protein